LCLEGGKRVPSVAKIAVYFLEGLFTVGIIGSALVIILTSIEDFEVFLTRPRTAEPSAEPEQPIEDQQPL
jgi:hypothetical protein